MRNYLSLALEEANIETVNGFIENFNTEHSEDGVQIHLVNAESALADFNAIHSAHKALQALDATTANMGDNVSVESMDVIKQYIGFINASTGFKISLEETDNSKGILARIWEAIKRFFAGIWNFITRKGDKQDKKIAANAEYSKDVLMSIITKMETDNISSVTLDIKKCKLPVFMHLKDKQFHKVPGIFLSHVNDLEVICNEFDARINEMIDGVNNTYADAIKNINSKEDINEFVKDGKEIFNHLFSAIKENIDKELEESTKIKSVEKDLCIKMVRRGADVLFTTTDFEEDIIVNHLNINDLKSLHKSIDEIPKINNKLKSVRSIIENKTKTLEAKLLSQSAPVQSMFNSSLKKYDSISLEEKINNIINSNFLSLSSLVIHITKIKVELVLQVADEMRYASHLKKEYFKYD